MANHPEDHQKRSISFQRILLTEEQMTWQLAGTTVRKSVGEAKKGKREKGSRGEMNGILIWASTAPEFYSSSGL
jgi:hypothetical protein